MCFYGGSWLLEFLLCVSMAVFQYHHVFQKNYWFLKFLWWFSTAMCYSGSLPTPQKGGKWADKQVQGEAPQIDKLTYTLVH